MTDTMGAKVAARAPRRILGSRVEERELLSRALAAAAGPKGIVRVLEAGCGQYWAIEVEGAELHVTGVDIDAEAMRIRREQHQDLDVEVVGDLREVDLQEGHFDVAYAASCSNTCRVPSIFSSG